jgi:antitoxin (DNA-binding transcriptional repressor) of toxin-antitoxin stability system
VVTVNVYEAKSRLSRLIAAAEAGETGVIARNGRPVAQLGPIPATPEFVFGDLAGSIEIADDFDAWGEAEERAWFGADARRSSPPTPGWRPTTSR